MDNKVYMCIDLKSFFASCECVDRNLDPLETNLVVADSTRTDKTVCLAVTPSLKEYGIGSRDRLYQVKSQVKNINFERLKKLKELRKTNRNKYNYTFTGKSYNKTELLDPNLELDYIEAKPRMALYIKYSSMIYNIYLKYLSEEDILVYSIDEVFCDITSYLKYYKLKPKQLVTKIIKDVYDTTGITATAGIGTNMYLAKIAMDVVAKKMPANSFGVRLAELNEYTFRKELWTLKPLTKFWMIGKGIEKRLNKLKIYTMGDLARKSLEDENLLYKEFGVNAELIIDHAWGYDNSTIEDCKNNKPQSKSLSSGQVLFRPTNYKDVSLLVREMIDLLSLDLINKRLCTKHLTLTLMYDKDNLLIPSIESEYEGETVIDYYGRETPKPGHGSINIDYYTNDTKVITEKMMELYKKIVNPLLLVRKINMSVDDLKDEDRIGIVREQIDLFNQKESYEDIKKNEIDNRKVNKAIIDIKNKYGKNSILKGMNYLEGGTTRERNKFIGGHHE